MGACTPNCARISASGTSAIARWSITEKSLKFADFAALADVDAGERIGGPGALDEDRCARRADGH
jgi:hypothetical protein